MLSTWTRTVMAAVVIIVIFGIVAGLAVSGRLGDLSYTNIPLVHPWPPTGYYQNPFNPAQKGDLINAQEAAAVRSDLLADGHIELQALRSGDGTRLDKADTGNNLARLREVLARNAAQGLTEDFINHITRVTVGRLADPNNASVTWCVEEVGTSNVTYRMVPDGSTAKRELLRFDDKFWLIEVNGRFLITDVQVSSQVQQGS